MIGALIEDQATDALFYYKLYASVISRAISTAARLFKKIQLSLLYGRLC